MTSKPSLRHGRPYLAIPGPSVMPDRVLQAMHRPAPNIYAGEVVDLTASLVPDLKYVAGTEHDVAIYIANGHGVWEAALSNVVAPGERVLVPATGRFGHGWSEMAAGIGAEAQILDFGKRSPWDLERIADALQADSERKIKAVLAVHVDTSTSIRNDVAGLREVLDETGHPALLMVDCIASLACDRVTMDAWGADVLVTGSQKGLMTPPGLGFVFFGPKAAAARQAMPRVSRYWDWVPRANPEFYYEYFGGTAPTHHLFALRAALDMIREEGIENTWARHATLARAIWAAAEAWGADGPMELNMPDPAFRSHAVTALRIGAPHGTALRDWVDQNLGLTLGIGLGMAPPGDPAWHGFFRIGHMGHVNGHMILGLLGGIDAALKALEIPHGDGALEAASTVIAGL
ncbi:pyridoxal-phosphate-dependent aminotransferase family protein [Marinibacterium profundimaris]|uniref:Septum site-determining protein n=1 Tax=Marinibacterium profundimaris TaxID=1679460 RepID=A0A225NFW5_9RHOB|nr:aminotransferase class V-fold PLP-dependent enzyme [Marinibacterium profundimaris]OWU72458.1 septum site-determining protein [Marinibacterium profundimaris]